MKHFLILQLNQEMDHSYRRNKNAFLKNRVEYSQPPLMLSGDDV